MVKYIPYYEQAKNFRKADYVCTCSEKKKLIWVNDLDKISSI